MSNAEGAGENSEWQKGGARFQGKRHSEYFDPCQEAADRSLKCLRRNGGDRGMCTDYFQAYKDCKQRWVGSFLPEVVDEVRNADECIDGGNEGGQA
ncbi:hypothetical protein D0860_05366 [Hortaea werneckii]|uniref:CHCH domain-containing protein n=1 Tax=Hortaea werneckii TaxID=91943 RepID=A0A3M7H0B2_HORWE|nr:hypothetical protein D0860_05366 [Hortaea werneckii]